MEDSVILHMKGVRKSFDTNLALDDVSFKLNSKEIHGLLGGNGAGKTTLMNVLYGLYRMDAGEVSLFDKKIEVHSPRDAIHYGIGMVHQHFLQVNTFTVLENIILGTQVEKRYSMKLKAEEKQLSDLCKRFSLEIDLHAVIETLPMGARQKVEILKALYRGVKILILDEPTTNLTPQEVDDLFKILRVMVNEGMSIVFITHKLREVLSVCDRISVLRDGRNVMTLTRDSANEDEFVKAMVGDVMDVEKSVIFARKGLEETLVDETRLVLQVENAQVLNADGIERLKKVSLQLYEGEVLGIAGVAGNGQHELAEAVMAVEKLHGGRVLVNGLDAAKLGTPGLFKNDVSYIPEDRLHDGFLPGANVAQNLILGFQRKQPYSSKGFINWKTVFELARRLISEYNIKTSGPDDVGGNLSGGNIQRVMVARAFSQKCRLLVAHNPTRGLDIPSMDAVYSKILAHKKQGMATLLLSEDLDELFLLSDRIAVLYRGELVGILPRAKFEKYEIGRMMSGVRANA